MEAPCPIFTEKGMGSMLKGRLNNHMRGDMLDALIAHAYDARVEALKAEGIELRNDAIHKILRPVEIEAVQTLLPQLLDGEDAHRQSVNWGGGVSVNCGGPTINVGYGSFGDYRTNYQQIEGALPILTTFGTLRLDLPADDPLAKRVQDWADRCEELRSERKVSVKQVRAALAAFSTVSQFQASWPDALPIVENILIEHLGRPAPSLPAVVIEEMNKKLGLPPSNDEAGEDREAA